MFKNLLNFEIHKKYIHFFKKKNKINIILFLYFSHLISTYKGWRVFFNLPSRGQRTWSNSKTCKNLNNKIKINKILLFENYNKKKDKNFLIKFIDIEFLNYFWKIQWFNEWNEKKKKRLILLKKNPWLTKTYFNKLKFSNLNNITIDFFLGLDIGFSKYIF
jgi:hypothetical protein